MQSNTTLLSIIEKILIEKGAPLKTNEITELVKAKNKDTSMKYSGSTIRSVLSNEIVVNKGKATFARFSKGSYGLRKWLNSQDYTEYFTKKRKVDPIDEVIAVIDREKINLLIEKPGLILDGIPEDLILKEYKSWVRHEAEEDLTLIQFVSVFIVHDGEKILTHKRTKRLPESRLHDEYSVMLGGHVLSEDLSSLFNPFDVTSKIGFILRELEEEVILDENYKVTPIGLIYDDSRDVSKQHIGLVFTVNTTLKKYTIGEKGFLIDHRAESISSIKNRIEDFENWSVTLIENFSEILKVEKGRIKVD